MINHLLIFLKKYNLHSIHCRNVHPLGLQQYKVMNNWSNQIMHVLRSEERDIYSSTQHPIASVHFAIGN